MRYEQEGCRCKRLEDVESETGARECRCKRREEAESETGAREVETGHVRECRQAVRCNTAAGRWAQPRFGAQQYIHVANAQLRRGMRDNGD